MNSKYRNIINDRFPWLIRGNDLCLILSDDIDSLVSVAILQKLFGYPIHYFYDFSGMYCNELSFLCPEPVGVDLALVQGKAVCNHVTRVSDRDSFNEQLVNLNLITDISVQNYTEKYAGSTAVFLYSLFRKELRIKETDLFWTILLSIDSYYLGYKPEFRERQRYYLADILELPEIYELQENHSFLDFEKVQNTLKMKEKIRFKNEQLNVYEDCFRELLTHLGLEVPKIENDFYQIEQYEKTVVPYGHILTVNKSNYSTFSCTYKRSGIATVYIN